MIEILQVSKQYKSVKAVDNISLTINEGETVALLGTSGCGKTTTLRLINRLTEPSEGSIKVNGIDVQKQPAEALRKGIGYVLQHHGLFPHYTIAENIALVPKLLHWSKDQIERRTVELISKLRLPTTIGSQYPSQLSGGQQQRVGLARALAANPPVLLMDEPFGALDTVTRTEVRKEFSSLEELKKKTVVLVTHDVEEAFELADRICIMDKGKIVQVGTAKELLFNPANDFVSSFLQHDKLRFEMQTTTVEDVWSFISDEINNDDNPETEITTSIWSALNKLSQQNQTGCTVYNQGFAKTITAAKIMGAFSAYKQNQQHHG